MSLYFSNRPRPGHQPVSISSQCRRQRYTTPPTPLTRMDRPPQLEAPGSMISLAAGQLSGLITRRLSAAARAVKIDGEHVITKNICSTSSGHVAPRVVHRPASNTLVDTRVVNNASLTIPTHVTRVYNNAQYRPSHLSRLITGEINTHRRACLVKCIDRLSTAATLASTRTVFSKARQRINRAPAVVLPSSDPGQIVHHSSHMCPAAPLKFRPHGRWRYKNLII